MNATDAAWVNEITAVLDENERLRNEVKKARSGAGCMTLSLVLVAASLVLALHSFGKREAVEQATRWDKEWTYWTVCPKDPAHRIQVIIPVGQPRLEVPTDAR